MAAVNSYRDLLVWQKAMDLVARSYRMAGLLPKAEMYGLTAQMQRAAVSIAANIAEGHGREHLGDYLHHLSMATGSLMELETHLLIAEKLEFVSKADTFPVLELAAEVGRMLAGLTRKLRQRNTVPST